MENIKNEFIKRCVYDTPLLLLAFKDKKTIDYINNLLPYSTGIEIECNKSPNFDIDLFRSIPDIIAINCDNSEQRFRIPNGINGMICLYNICQQLKHNSELNFGSGIHYHIDTTGFHDEVVRELEKNEESVLKELDSWNYQGNYNKRGISTYVYGTGMWVRQQKDFKTLEFRIGEMSFDYNLIIKRIFHCQSIVKNLAINAGINDKVIFNETNNLLLLDYFHRSGKEYNLDTQLKNMREDYNKIIQNTIKQEEQEEDIDNDNIRDIIKNRLK